MLKYLAKVSKDIFPSVLATVIGAYIVNHYIVARTADPPAAAAVSPADSKKATENKTDSTPAQKASADTTSAPALGVTAKGISERTLMDKSASERAETKPSEAKPAEGKTEKVNAPAEPSRHQPPREKTVAKTTPVPAPVVAPPVVTSPSVESAATQPAAEEHRDANDLARAAIDRLRNSGQDASPPQAPRTVIAAPPIRPLGPPIAVSTQKSETYGAAVTGSLPTSPPYTAAIRTDDPNRLIPPADIPAQGLAKPHDDTTVADDMLSAAKSVFNAVLPKVPATD
jgi:hypothetical protein